MAKNRSLQDVISKELLGLLVLISTLLAFLGLVSFTPENSTSNFLGLIGHGIGWFLRFSFGLASYLLLTGLFLLSLKWISKEEVEELPFKCLLFTLVLFSTTLLLNLLAEIAPALAALAGNSVVKELIAPRTLRYNLGGLPSYYILHDLPFLNLQRLLSNTGTFLVFTAIALAAGLELTAWKPAHFCLEKLNSLKERLKRRTIIPVFEKSIKKPATKELMPDPLKRPPLSTLPSLTAKLKTAVMREIQPRTKEPVPSTLSKPLPKTVPVPNPAKAGDYVLPPLALLTDVAKFDTSLLHKELQQQARVLEETLLSFGIEAQVGQISCGPTIVSFEVQPAIGVKVQKIKALENDIALNMQAKSLRIIAPIPGKACVGIEIPSPRPQEVGFKEMLEAYRQSGKAFQIPVLLGKAVSGEEVTCDLTKMPHCIIAGATGSGKSVCINTLVMSILMSAGPDTIRLLMVDPKKVELTAYSNLPHMIAPVITEAKGAAAALHWLVREMEKRYEILKVTACRNILGFNNRENRSKPEGTHLEIPDTMPYIVAIIDEMADLMIAAAGDIEMPITRIAQMARAVGIHLILATQRPSREVITGLIKANFPTRIAFKVANRINSQIILDEIGAETLLGNGDMLFLPPGTSLLTRAQGAFIRDEDINRVIDFIGKQRGPSYLIPSFDNFVPEERLQGGKEEDTDDLYNEALEIVQSTGNASTTFLQRKLKIGYARAASLMDQLESRGIIGPQEGAKPRKVLVFKTALQEDDIE